MSTIGALKGRREREWIQTAQTCSCMTEEASLSRRCRNVCMTKRPESVELEPFIASDILEMPETNLLICRWRHPDLKREALYLVSDSGDIKCFPGMPLVWIILVHYGYVCRLNATHILLRRIWLIFAIREMCLWPLTVLLVAQGKGMVETVLIWMLTDARCPPLVSFESWRSFTERA